MSGILLFFGRHSYWMYKNIIGAVTGFVQLQKKNVSMLVGITSKTRILALLPE